MSGPEAAPSGQRTGPARPSVHRNPADVAYRRAWWSLALYPVSFVGAFVIGEGLISLLTDDVGTASSWQLVVAATPALLVFAVPGILAAGQGSKAVRLGRRDGKVPAVVGATIGIALLGVNLLSYVVGLVFG